MKLKQSKSKDQTIELLSSRGRQQHIEEEDARLRLVWVGRTGGLTCLTTEFGGVCAHSKLREDALRVNLAPESVGGRVFRPVHRHIVTSERDWCCGVEVPFSTVCRRGTWTST